jgi:hypothetical protein
MRMTAPSPRSLRRAYLDWIEEQVEEFKDSIPRSQLLFIAEQVVEELRMTRGGQYQLTELLLCTAVDRHLVRLLKLPGYRAWAAQRRAEMAERAALVIPLREIVAAPPPAVHVAAGVEAREPERMACVV